MTPQQLKNLGAFLRLVKDGKNETPLSNEVFQRLEGEISEGFVNDAANADKTRIHKERISLDKKEKETKLKMQMGKESIEKLRRVGITDRKRRKEIAQETLKQNARKSKEANFTGLLKPKGAGIESTTNSIGGELDGISQKYASEDFEKLVSQAQEQETGDVATSTSDGELIDPTVMNFAKSTPGDGEEDILGESDGGVKAGNFEHEKKLQKNAKNFNVANSENVAEDNRPAVSSTAEVLESITSSPEDIGQAETIGTEGKSLDSEFALGEFEEEIPHLEEELEESDDAEEENFMAQSFQSAQRKEIEPIGENKEINKKEVFVENDNVELSESEQTFVADARETLEDEFDILSSAAAKNGAKKTGTSISTIFDSKDLVALDEVADLRRLNLSELEKRSSVRDEVFESFKENNFKFVEDIGSDLYKHKDLEEEDLIGGGKGSEQEIIDIFEEGYDEASEHAEEEISQTGREEQAEELILDDTNDRPDGAIPGDVFFDEVATDIAKKAREVKSSGAGEINGLDLEEATKKEDPVEPMPSEQTPQKKNMEIVSPEDKISAISEGGEISSEVVNDFLGELGSEALAVSEEGALSNEEDSKTAEETQKKIDFERALGIIETYSAKNKKIILSALESDILEDEESNIVAKRVINGDDEDYVAAYVANREYLKSFREDPRKDVASFKEQQVYVQDYFKKQRALKFLRLVASVVFFAVFSFVFVFFGLDYIRSTYYYLNAFDDLKEKEYLIAEDGFEKAYDIRKSLSWANDFAREYALRGRFEQAEKKYLLALRENENHRETLLNYGDLHIYTGDFIRAQQKFKKVIVKNPEDVDAMFGLARTYIEWGSLDSAQWEKGDAILTELVKVDGSENLKYLAKKMEIAGLRRDFETSKFYYIRINDKDADFYDRVAFRRYTDFLIDNYGVINSKISDNPVDFRTTKKNNFTVATVEANIRKMLQTDPDYFPVYYSIANWFDLLNESDKAEKWLDQGISIFEEKDPSEVYVERYPPVNVYNLKGKIEYTQGDIFSAREAFRKSVEYSQENSFANYFLGKIDLQFNENFESARNYFKRAYNNWSLQHDDKYRDLVYAYGYVHYREGLEKGDEGEILLAIQYWSSLMDDPLLKQDHVIEFALVQAYLQLKKYELGEAFASENIRRLQPSLNFYKKNEGRVIPSIRNSVGMLSDSYNNLGVAYAAKAFSSEVLENRYVYKQKAVENFINSITLKEELELLRGVPYANFNRINAFPQRTDEFLISDQLLAKTLLP